MNLREYAQTKPQEQPAQVQPVGAVRSPIEQYQDVIRHYRFNREVANGCIEQIMQDIENHESPYRMLLAAIEALGRLSDKGDTLFLQVQRKLIEAYGTDEPPVF